ncbi:hypothetical protein Cantr_00183 [Candida viswanathii]|uniref:Protein PAL1 n=1 Tax=Candida viswanathii TaxID=5486 RepID=A0A367YEZ8_9ASCO|nr:hypothetical protein Cantr_00183 [Candida viswanathii]
MSYLQQHYTQPLYQSVQTQPRSNNPFRSHIQNQSRSTTVSPNLEQSPNSEIIGFYENGGGGGSTEYFPSPAAQPRFNRADSDSSVNYSSNNPFASEMENSPQRQNLARQSSSAPRRQQQAPPPRPPKEYNAPPPPYTPSDGSSGYPKEKESRSTSEHRSRDRPRDEHRSRDRPRDEHRSRDRPKDGSERPRDRDREHRSHRSHHKSSSSSKKKSQPKEAVKPKNMDTIDKLDVTGFVGMHHDGPFDACTRFRNINESKSPVNAFPIDGPNNSISGAAAGVDHFNMVFGNYDNESDVASKQTVMNFDSNTKGPTVHGPTTAGLGTTTFVDGAPAPKALENSNSVNSSNGLGRKKSLVQRLRNNSDSNSRRSSSDALRVASPEPPRRGSLNTLDLDEDDDLKPPASNSFIRRVKSLKVRR